jgi:hypothetical protein
MFGPRGKEVPQLGSEWEWVYYCLGPTARVTSLSHTPLTHQPSTSKMPPMQHDSLLRWRRIISRAVPVGASHINGVTCCQMQAIIGKTSQGLSVVRPPISWGASELLGPEEPKVDLFNWAPPVKVSFGPFGPEALLVSDLVGTWPAPMPMTLDDPADPGWMEPLRQSPPE